MAKGYKPFRVWVHPKKGSDYFYEFDTLEQAKAGKAALEQKKGIAHVEEPIRFENGQEKPVSALGDLLRFDMSSIQNLRF